MASIKSAETTSANTPNTRPADGANITSTKSTSANPSANKNTRNGSSASRKRLRHSYGRLSQVMKMPNLIEVQKESYNKFLQMEPPKKGTRLDEGLQAVFQSVFPINDFTGRASLEFIDYSFGVPKYDVEECQKRDMTFAAPLRLRLRLIVFDIDEETKSKSVRDVKEQEVYMGDLPLMTDNGTFIVNGTERVIVSQMHRSPGVFFDHDQGKSHSSGKLLFSGRIIPYRGSWLDFEFDAKDILYARIDRKRRLPATVLLHALGYERKEILNLFYKTINIKNEKTHWTAPFEPSMWRGQKLSHDLINAQTGKMIEKKGAKLTSLRAKKLQEKGLKYIKLECQDLVGRHLASKLIDPQTGEPFANANMGDEITEKHLGHLDKLLASGKKLSLLDIDLDYKGPFICNTLKADKSDDRISALEEIYRVMRPGEPPTEEMSQTLFSSLFFESQRYDLSSVGRVKMNARLDLDCSDNLRVLRKEDIVAVMQMLVSLRDGRDKVDDIDHLGNRRVRSVGELMENQYRIGLLRMERAIKERMGAVSDIDNVMPQEIINAKPAVSAVREFFGSSQLSQFMDQTNPLSEITHKRRLSALGPGGLTRERAGFEVRDVHPTHYGRICPVETPEGPNIGLISSLATFARVNKYGFIESPYRLVNKGRVTNEVKYLTADKEERYHIAQANIAIDSEGKISDELVNCRHKGDFEMVKPEQVDFLDVSPKQIISVAAALIPFLENDDANRALMGSNMMRQAVPLLESDAPMVGTGMEVVVARDSGASVMARRTGIVDQVDALRIVIRATENLDSTKSSVDIYNLRKFQRSNQSTCINQRPIISVGDKISKGDVIADGPCTDLGELALGKNVLVAFMPWDGYNFEDSILISERLVRDDVFTSIHLEEFEVIARDTKLGPEDITRDIPNVGEDALRNLDEVGIVYVGAKVKPGDILVGKVTPKGETPMTPEEKLLRAIFGEKASNVRDTSLKLPPGAKGTVVEVRIFNRHGIETDGRAEAIQREEIEGLAKDRDDELAILERNIFQNLFDLLIGGKIEAVPQSIAEAKDETLIKDTELTKDDTSTKDERLTKDDTSTKDEKLKKGDILTKELLDKLPKKDLWNIILRNQKTMGDIKALRHQYDESKTALQKRFEDKAEKLQRGDELPPGVMKIVKVLVAVKRKLQPGDKMAGRHGNKGVISRIMPLEDMPYLADGQPVDIVLNPLGVPSRMNVGQILETHLGWACAGLGKKVSAAIESYEKEGNAEAVRQTLGEIYPREDTQSLSNNESLGIAHPLRKGAHMATPVFDGARERDIVDALKVASLDTSGQVRLYDGRTGEAFDRKVTVGYIYMLKLHHLVDDKIHARSVGPYSLVTQQPLGGKAQFGGQRFGEMEVWALEAYGAAYTLQEILTVKSDDVAGRTKVYEAIVKGDDVFETGIPESFNVLVKEIRSLGLSVDLSEAKKIESQG